MNARRLFVVAPLALAVAAASFFILRGRRDARLPDSIASGNGRIEAQEVHVAAKTGGRVAAVLADEGALVAAGQTLARLDAEEAAAAAARAEAQLASAKESVAEAEALAVQRASGLTLA
ncbi:MAG: biotin/lipoyl-binding protein, partial [Elusimicrobia bacterium]|nr:biotin/lipoyl-binding protein [Elusimicrobiota bacterium]